MAGEYCNIYVKISTGYIIFVAVFTALLSRIKDNQSPSLSHSLDITDHCGKMYQFFLLLLLIFLTGLTF
jgi:hypothetical protein